MTTRDCPECGYNAACSPDCKTGTHPRDVRVPAPEEGTGESGWDAVHGKPYGFGHSLEGVRDLVAEVKGRSTGGSISARNEYGKRGKFLLWALDWCIAEIERSRAAQPSVSASVAAELERAVLLAEMERGEKCEYDPPCWAHQLINAVRTALTGNPREEEQ
jgi:hypothetical protein